MKRLWGAVLLLLVCTCVWAGGEAGRLEPVHDPAVLAFADRIGAFYARLEKMRLDALTTFEDAELRSYFQGAREFSDYYALLASQVRSVRFRNARADQVLVREFRFEGEDLAFVDITLVGKHERALRFWSIELSRTDVWRRTGGIWTLTPDKL